MERGPRQIPVHRNACHHLCPSHLWPGPRPTQEGRGRERVCVCLCVCVCVSKPVFDPPRWVFLGTGQIRMGTGTTTGRRTATPELSERRASTVPISRRRSFIGWMTRGRFASTLDWQVKGAWGERRTNAIEGYENLCFSSQQPLWPPNYLLSLATSVGHCATLNMDASELQTWRALSWNGRRSRVASCPDLFDFPAIKTGGRNHLITLSHPSIPPCITKGKATPIIIIIFFFYLRVD